MDTNKELNNRQIKIIDILYRTNNVVSSKALAEEVKCSAKTIQLEVKNINNIVKGITINSIKGSGYELNGDESVVKAIISNIDNRDVDRINYILKKMILLYSSEVKTIKLENLADDIYVSISTLKNNLKEVKEILKQYNLNIVSKHRLGICLEGDIEDIKRCIISLSLVNMDIKLEDFLDKDIIDNKNLIRSILLKFITEDNINLTDSEFNDMFSYILISMSLSKCSDYNKYIMKYSREYRNKLNLENTKSINSKEIIIKAIDEFTNNLNIATSIDITKDDIFKEYLYKHISSFCIKNELGIEENLCIDDSIKFKYPFEFELAKIAKKTLEDSLNINIDDQEIGNIAIHVGAALERIDYKANKKVLRAIIVCTSGIGTSMLLKTKLEAKFSNRMEIVRVIPSYLIDYVSILGIDFIISTVPVEVKDIPVISISPFLNEDECKLIEKFLDTGKVYHDINIQSLFNKELFLVDLEFMHKHDAIEYMSSELLEKGYIDEEMKISYHERENIATTEIGNLVAIPHGSKGKVNKNSIVIGILKKSIHWEIGDVRLIVMLCLDKDSILDYEVLFSQIYKRVDSIAKVISICESKNFDKFIAMFK